MKRVGILTFHASHNYGSMLQNFALQRIISSLSTLENEIDVETINFRTEKQKELYRYFVSYADIIRHHGLLLQMFLERIYQNSLKNKNELFEHFLIENLKLSKEVKNDKQLRALPKYDKYIVGSDQMWNTTALDFEWSYFLDFVPPNLQKYSYAASMGPHPERVQKLDVSFKEKIARSLNSYQSISARDKRTAKELQNLGVTKEIRVDLDPTLLLTAEEWSRYIPEEPVYKKSDGYILLYHPRYDKHIYDEARNLSERTGLKVVCTVFSGLNDLHYPTFHRQYGTGPWEFLNLIKNATYVIGGSFHLIVFSILFNRPFIAVDGMSDSRIRNLLTLCNLDFLSTTKENKIENILKQTREIDFEAAVSILEKERKKSISYLRCILR